ncbi:MAG: protein kinase [Cellvibrionaceae bacterium]
MDKKSALTLIGLEEGGCFEEITKAYSEKVKKIERLVDEAPRSALKEKYQKKLAQLNEAKSLLLEQLEVEASASSFSQSKFSDLPFAKPRHSQYEEKAQAELDIQEGHILAGRYKIEEKIAAGGMGVVYRAHDQNRNEDIAIKVMLPSLVKNQRARDKFMDEARLSSKLSHPNIVNVYDVQNEGDLYFITMELLEGQDLRDVMDNRKTARQPFTKDEALELLEQITNGLNHAHQSTVHSDLKPENIFLTEDGIYKVMDFGIARVQSASQHTQSGAVNGTAYYMAPEQLKGAKHLDARTDQYALAVLTYELLTGEVPTGMVIPLSDLRPDIGKGFSFALERALANRPEERYDSLNDFLVVLKKGKATKALKRNTHNTTNSVAGKLAMVAVLLLAVGLVVGIWQSGLVDADRLLISKEEAAKKNAANAKLVGEIKTLQKRLETGRRMLNNDVRDARRNRDDNQSALEYWQHITEDAIFEGSTLVELEGQLAMAQTLLRDGRFDLALQHFTAVKAGYKNLYTDFQAGEHLFNLRESVQAYTKHWLSLKHEYGIKNIIEERNAERFETQAKQQEKEGKLATANASWNSSVEVWRKINRNAINQVEAVKKRRETRKQAAIKAERERKEEAERKRLADIEAEKQRKAEAERQRLLEKERKAEKERKRLADIEAEKLRQKEEVYKRLFEETKRTQ